MSIFSKGDLTTVADVIGRPWNFRPQENLLLQMVNQKTAGTFSLALCTLLFSIIFAQLFRGQIDPDQKSNEGFGGNFLGGPADAIYVAVAAAPASSIY